MPSPSAIACDRVLVVDDAPDNVLLVQSILEEEGYDIITAETGRDALAAIDASPPDLILLDVMMPGMDGFEVTKRVRARPDLPFIPILLITAYDQPSVVQGLDTGADDFIRKPVEVDELLARVLSLLRPKHSVDERDEIARQRADFVSRLTHDLRTPLVAADRMLGLFQQEALGPLAPEMREAIDIMARSNRNLLDMVNTLLEVYRYEAGRKTLSFTEVDLRALLDEVMAELRPLAEEKQLTLAQHCEVEAVVVRGDRLELRRVLTNLIGNAIKFTDTGSVTARLSASEHAAVVTIRDTGPGIAADERATVFERFRHGKHRNSGSGLGLHLSRRILDQHDGTIALDSEVGEGSCFTVQLPARSSSSSPAA